MIFLDQEKQTYYNVTKKMYDNVSHQPGIDKTCLYPKDPYEVKTNCLFTRTEVKN